MGGTGTETCGRCAMTSVVDTAQQDEEDGDRADRDPFSTGSIEVDDAEARRVSPGAWFAGITGWLDDVATRLTYGRR